MIYYTYHICWTEYDMHYYGVRGTQVDPKTDLWISYFTSSKYVKKFRAEYGDPNVIEIRKCFGPRRDDALMWEHKVLRRLSIVPSNKWLNRYCGTYKGAPGPKDHGWKISRTTKGRKQPVESVNRINKNPEKIRKTAEKHRGMKRSTEAKQRMSDAKKEYIQKNGQHNKGLKQYYNPNDVLQTVQCDPLNAPEGWVHGNPKKKGKRPYINVSTNVIKWMYPVDVDTTEWMPWNANSKKG